jgi:hypothetical protein
MYLLVCAFVRTGLVKRSKVSENGAAYEPRGTLSVAVQIAGASDLVSDKQWQTKSPNTSRDYLH